MLTFNDSIYSGIRLTNSGKIEASTYLQDPLHRFYGVNTPMVEVQVPFYSNYRARIVGDDRPSANYAMQYVFKGEPGEDSYRFFEAGADDFSFWFLVGPPPVCCVNYNPTQNNSIKIYSDGGVKLDGIVGAIPSL